jgi:putative membrane protein
MNTGIRAAYALGAPFLQMDWGNDHTDGWGWGGWLLMSVLMILFWGTVVALAIWFVRSMAPHSHHDAASSALDIARDRYARGEISDEEFQRIRTGLSR